MYFFSSMPLSKPMWIINKTPIKLNPLEDWTIVRNIYKGLSLSLWYWYEAYHTHKFEWYLIKSSQSGVYVFSSFPPPRPRPPPPQRLLFLTSKPFELNLRYLGQRKYRSGKMYWVTLWWPWPKVTAVTLINKKWLVRRIKLEPLTQSLQNLVAIALWSCLSPG